MTSIATDQVVNIEIQVSERRVFPRHTLLLLAFGSLPVLEASSVSQSPDEAVRDRY